jgi:multiple sugar transport system permease protein
MATRDIAVPSLPTARKSILQRLSSRQGQKTFAFYIFIAPWLLGFVFLIVLPLIGGFWISLTNYDGLNLTTAKFMGLKNYTRIFDDRQAMRSLQLVFKWMALNTPIWLISSFVLAYILNHALRARGLFRTLFYLPSVIPLVAVAKVGQIMLNKNFGLVNQVLDLVAPGTAVNWLTEQAMYSLTSLAVWTGLGSGMVIFLAGLQNIPTELEEAAIVDGAGKLRVFWHITIPLMTPVIFYQLVLSVVTALQYYALPFLMAPNTASNVGTLARNAYLYMIHVIRQAFGFQRYGYATAMNWFLVVIILVFTAFLFGTRRFWVYESV